MLHFLLIIVCSLRATFSIVGAANGEYSLGPLLLRDHQCPHAIGGLAGSGSGSGGRSRSDCVVGMNGSGVVAAVGGNGGPSRRRGAVSQSYQRLVGGGSHSDGWGSGGGVMNARELDAVVHHLVEDVAACLRIIMIEIMHGDVGGNSSHISLTTYLQLQFRER